MNNDKPKSEAQRPDCKNSGAAPCSVRHPDVIELVKVALKEKGFDGLHYDGECGCDIDDLAPCGEITAHCEAGYKVEAPMDSDASYDWYICHSKEDRPWETQE